MMVGTKLPGSQASVCAAFLVGLALSLSGCSGSDTPPTAPRPPSVPPPLSRTTANTPSPPAPPSFNAPSAPPVAPLSCAACRKVVFTSSRHGNDELYTVEADGTGLTRLTNDPASDDHAAWSPDGKRLAFTSRNGEDSALVVMNADGSNRIRHTLPHSASYPTWSPDGTTIAYGAISDGSLNLWTVAADGGYPLLLFSAPGWDAHPAWSPDGAKLALVSDWFAYDFGSDIFVIDSHGAGFTPVTDGNIFDQMSYLWPAWAPDGARIATTIQHDFTYVAYIAVMSADGAGLKPLVAAAPWSKNSWSPDGSTIAFTSGNATTQDVAWVKNDGSAQGTLVSNGRNAAWQP